MKTRLNLLLALWVSAVSAATPSGGTLPTQEELLQLLKASQFEQLEQLADGFRREKHEFYKGPFKLDNFYDEFLINRNLDDRIWNDHISLLKNWAAARPDSPTPLIALGNVYSSYAWKARGGGYANTVSDEGWRLFRERLLQAQQVLETAERMAVQDPAAYCNHIPVAMGLSEPKEQIDVLFKKGVALDPNYLQLYRSKAHYLLPRWLGEPGDWEAFAKEAADARGGEEGDMLYVIIVQAESDTEGDALFRNTRFSYQRMKRGFEAMLNRDGDTRNLWDMNSYCYFACIAGDRAKAKELFQKINGRWEKGVWDTPNVFQQWENWALRNGSAPVAPSRSRPPELNRASLRTALLIGGIIWLVIAAGVVAGVWQLARNYRKSG